jgi:hypothetical protein
VRGNGLTLAASEAREALFLAALPVFAAAGAACRVAVEEMLLVIQLHPLVLQVLRRPTVDQPASRLTDVRGDRLPPTLSDALDDAAQAFAAGVLSAIGDRAASKTLNYAASVRDGGLCVVVDPLDGSAQLILAGAGAPFSEAVLLGAVGDAREMTAH